MSEVETAKSKLHRMTHDPVDKLVISLAIPSIISMMVSAVYNMADTFFVSRLGTSATGGVGVCFSVMAIIQAIGFTFGQGSGNTISRLLGRGERDQARMIASTGFFTSFSLAAVLAIIGSFFILPIVRFLGATDTIAPYAADYLKFIFLGMPFIASSFVLNNLLRYQGSAAYAMIGIMAGGFLNIILDPILIFTLDMGVAGASLATAISQFVSFSILLIQCGRGANIMPSVKDVSRDIREHFHIVKNGFPTLLRQSLASVAAIVLNTSAAPFGDAAIAAMSIVTRVLMFSISALLGFGQGFQPVCGFNFGAGRHDRVRKAFWFSVKSSTMVLLGLSVVGLAFAPQIMAIFRKEDLDVIRIGTLALRAQFLVLPLSSFTILAMMMTQTIGRSGTASLLALARQGLFFVPLVVILPGLIGVTGVQISQPISDLFAFSLSFALTLPILNDMKKEPSPLDREKARQPVQSD